MKFKKYPSLISHYQVDTLSWWLNKYPELGHQSYVVTEKLHGSCLTVNITKDLIDIGSRVALIESDNKFYGYKCIKESYKEMFEILQEYLKISKIDNLTLYGEFFGKGIQKGVQYGEKQYRIFDLAIEGKLVPFYALQSIFKILQLEEYLIPIYKVASSFKEAYNYNIEKDSVILGIENNQIEGVVIKPYRTVYMDNDKLFSVKKKNEKFKEKSMKSDRIKKEIPQELINKREELALYVNNNRVWSAFSKLGVINSFNDITKYMRFIMEDVEIDYFKDNGVIDKKELKVISKLGNKKCVELLKNYILNKRL